jgi:hypothetical protein
MITTKIWVTPKIALEKEKIILMALVLKFHSRTNINAS